MGEVFDVEQRWPELFAPLDRQQRWAVSQSVAIGWHEGWEPNREDVANLVDNARGVIDDEYLRRARERARRVASDPG